MSSSRLVQLPDYAFTIRGDAYELDDVYQNRPDPWFVTARATSSKNNNLEHIVVEDCPTSIDTEAEAAEPIDKRQQKYLVVGVLPLRAPKGKESAVPKKSGTSVGKTVPPNHLKPVENRIALRVVTPVTEHRPNPLKLYALYQQDSKTGIYDVNLTNAEATYYLSEYRSDDTSIESRKREWHELIKTKSVRGAGVRYSDTTLSEAGPAYRGDPTRVAVKQIGIELRKFGVASYAGVLQKANEVIDDGFKTAIEESPLLSCLGKFISITGTFNEGDAADLSRLVNRYWPGVRNVNPQRLMLLRKGIEEGKVALSTRESHLFLSIACSELKLKGEEGIVQDLVINTALLAKEMLGTDFRTVIRPSSTVQNHISDYMDAVIDQIERGKAEIKDIIESLQTRHGTNMLSPDDIYSKLPFITDLDGFRAMHEQGIAYWMRQYDRPYRSMSAILDRLIDDLKKLNKDITGDQ
ncbi:hypothetical protein TCE0_033f09419 [Talaromyces pinophilus]|jgi:hypothetical protein|uniref:Uncharacterized protein n=1 Tax=Talaromyces pinophilus TaxID=128442 RepID=A0A6V8HBL7_TALPI|nr:hypothetical protein TCE0_033f09419 [Talaromyces pinophilus]